MSEQTKNLLGGNYNPDVLECLANLSNDEVFTPPKVVNSMLDMLPPETWSNPNLTFLDPACKTGVFLREIAKRLIVGLENQIPDLQERLDHIFHKQLYGIAITELTALASRRSLYCSKYANGKYSVSKFDNPDGNIRFIPIQHTWENGKCKYCGANAGQYQRADDLETHAYEFIHTNNPEEIFGMKFDVIIGNPPYQLSDGAGGNGSSAIPLYNKFVINSKRMNPTYLSFIIPSRWQTGGKGLDDFRNEMIHDAHVQIMHDFVDSKECFAGVDIKGGVCYFLRNMAHNGPCEIYTHSSDSITKNTRYLAEDGDDVFIRSQTLVDIKNKVWPNGIDKNIAVSSITSSRKPYGLTADVIKDPKKYGLPELSKTPIEGGYRLLGLGEKNARVYYYFDETWPIPKKAELKKWKLFVPKAYGCGAIGEVPSTPVLGTPVLGTPVDACTETFLQIGPFINQEEAKNFLSYLRTKFFRVMVGIIKTTQNTSQSTYRYVPLQDFSKPWTDEELYKKYNLSDEEIKFIEDNITPMEDK